jgi:hypothetical protein
MTDPLHSTGRGGSISVYLCNARKFTDYLSGAGNIGYDPTKYELSTLAPKDDFRRTRQSYNSFEVD